MKWLTFKQAQKIPEGSVVVTRLKWEGRITKYHYSIEPHFKKERDTRYREKGYQFTIIEKVRAKK